MMILPSPRPIGAPPSSLIKNLIGWWNLGEASGTRFDSTSNHLDLTAVNNPGNTPGVIGNAIHLVKASSQYCTRANESLLQTGNVDFTVAAWARLTTDVAGNIAAKQNVLAAEWNMANGLNAGTLEFTAYPGGSPNRALIANPGTGVWFFIVGWWDSSALTAHVQLNNGTPVDQVAGSSAIVASTASFDIGTRFGGLLEDWNGDIGPVGLWKSAAGGGGILTTTQRTNLYNVGAGVTFPFVGVP